jgi:hypothetical protein
MNKNEKIKFLLMKDGRLQFEYISNCSIPKKNDIITISNNNTFLNFEVKFIQYFFNKELEFEYILITAIYKL